MGTALTLTIELNADQIDVLSRAIGAYEDALDTALAVVPGTEQTARRALRSEWDAAHRLKMELEG